METWVIWHGEVITIEKSTELLILYSQTKQKPPTGTGFQETSLPSLNRQMDPDRNVIKQSSSKRGLGWSWDNKTSEFSMYTDAVAQGKISWLFNWEMWKPEGLPLSLDYVPQVRLGSQAQQIDQMLGPLNGPTHFIGFNEPEMASESKMDVSVAVALWKEYVKPAKDKYHFLLGSPAISSAPVGKQWLQNFFKELEGSDSVDFVVVHWYGTDVKALESFILDMYAAFEKPLWLNEFACSHLSTSERATAVEVEEFLKQALPFLDNCPHVERYAFFGAKTDVGAWVGEANNCSSNGTLTDVGRLYTEA